MELDTLRRDPVKFSASENSYFNADHYGCRKEYIEKCYDDELHVTLFDDDTYHDAGIWGYLSECVNRDDFLGTISIPLKKLKEPGIQHFEVKLHGTDHREETGIVVSFSTEYIAFEGKLFAHQLMVSVRMAALDACEEMGTKKSSGEWITEEYGIDFSVPDGRNWLAEFGQVKLHPIAFINVPSTDTQVSSLRS